MNCPFCGSSQIMVVNSRPTAGGSQIWRRRKCAKCGSAFTSYERMDLSHLIIIKKSGRHQKFSRAKLYSGIYCSFLDKKETDRGEVAELVDKTTSRVEREIIELKRKKINSSEIEEIVSEILGRKNPEALLRFLAYRIGGDSRKLKGSLRRYLK